MKRPLGVFEFDVPLDDLTDDEIDTLADEIVEAMRKNLAALPPVD